ncbi:hypothetical protein OKW21_002400 [Catalinimonas alkaloidigena]|uniref:hypothetical protein n=1 Tax=Catalinimonas alkaloidigena TaxID=1075417 RepID=UPI002405194C|nr:hypothetical protein [Catalinimonas alkaloidigena]MDF9797137.1 hypothetical protein [Catalinimonas alkaloidigena]
MELTKLINHKLSQLLTNVLSIILVLVFTGPAFHAISSSVLANLNYDYEHSELMELEDISLEGEENKGEKEKEKEENDALKEFTLSDVFSVNLSALEESALCIIYLNHLIGTEIKLITPPPKI